MNTVVLGIGNRLMTDDGIGVYVVEELINSYKNNIVSYVIGETDVYYCLDVAECFDKLIIIDSMWTGNLPGTIQTFTLQERGYKAELELSLHNVSVISLIREKFKYINGTIIGIEIFKIDYGIGLSKYLKEYFPRIVNEVNNVIQKLIK